MRMEGSSNKDFKKKSINPTAPERAREALAMTFLGLYFDTGCHVNPPLRSAGIAWLPRSSGALRLVEPHAQGQQIEEGIETQHLFAIDVLETQTSAFYQLRMELSGVDVFHGDC
jgi:hypothetical protein